MNIPHCKPFFPPVEEYKAKIDLIWQNGWLTNQGPLVVEFEEKIAAYFGLKHVSFVSSGTMGLQCALRTLGGTGEIITTPYSYVATSSAIFWEGFKPVFADIDPITLGLDAALVEQKITPQTRAILATHVYGIPASVEALQNLAEKYNIRLIFDAAHAFGTRYKDRSLLDYGDMAVLSLHATKLFHTANGGLVVCKSAEAKKKIDSLKNFGHNGPNNFDGPGINGKNSELHAALGLCNLQYADDLLAQRQLQWTAYKVMLSKVLSDMNFISIGEETIHNGAYFPILNLDSGTTDRIINRCNEAHIEIRRYFSPSLNQIDYLKGDSCPVSERLAKNVICLPLFHNLTPADQEQIVQIVTSCLSHD